MRTCGIVLLSVFFVITFLFGLFLLIPFPLAIFQQIVNSQVVVQRKSDGQFPTSTYFWSRLPAVQHFNFYFFNITNPDEVLYNGAVPNLVEVGPYSYAETEFKDFFEWRDNDNMIFYQNNKTWIYDQSKSCADCSHDDILMLPNAAYMTAIYMQVTQPSTPIVQLGIDVLTMLLGEQPLRVVPMAGVLFESYPDPFLDLINSDFTKTLMSILGNPLPLPQIPAMGYFPLYNHTNDGNYTMKTGKDDVKNVALIQKWCDLSRLDWWKTPEAQDISQSGDGSFQKPGLKKTDKLKQFQSFTCRAFDLHYNGEDTSKNGIPAYGFSIDDDAYDSIKYAGYRYENLEQVDYFPNWPCGPNHTYNPQGNCALVDCGIDFCSPCCKGSYVNGTYLLPPGIVPLRCLPGQLKALPFAGFLSPPHFAQSPETVKTSMPGLKADLTKHNPGTFYINPTTGSTVDAVFRMQLTIPIYKNLQYTLMSNLANSFLPSFWVEIDIQMRQYAIDYLKFNMVTVPYIVLGVGIGSVVLSIILLIIAIVMTVRRRRKAASKLVLRSNQRLESSWNT